jgi:hypothetical protein
MGATQLYTTASPSVSSLFTGDTYYMNKTLQDYYQVGGAGTTAFTPTPMPGQHRSGLLTHPGFLAVNARPGVTAPINRGFFVLANIMCLQLQMPVGLQFPQLPEGPTQGLTTREVIANMHVKPQCAGCHDMIDPPGFALEGFDQLGKVRMTDNGKPVDTSGTIVNSGGGTALMSTDLDGPFATGDEFLQRLAQSRTVRACFAKQFLEHAVSGQVSTAVAPEDQGSVACLSQKFAQSGDLVGLLGLVASSDTFLLRKAE